MTINHNDVYDFLHGLRKELGIDLISQPKMVQIHGKTYPTVGNNLHLDETDGWGSINIRIPHENSYLTDILSVGLVPSRFSTTLVNDMVPGTHKTKSGLTRNTFNVGKSGENREGPYNMDRDGALRQPRTGAEKHFHDFIKDISNKSSPDGTSCNYYSGPEDNKIIPRNQMKGFDLLDAVGHMREYDLGMTMPKGTEHHLGVSTISDSGQVGSGAVNNKYLYDIGSESLTEVPKEMHITPADVN